MNLDSCPAASSHSSKEDLDSDCSVKINSESSVDETRGEEEHVGRIMKLGDQDDGSQGSQDDALSSQDSLSDSFVNSDDSFASQRDSFRCDSLEDSPPESRHEGKGINNGPESPNETAEKNFKSMSFEVLPAPNVQEEPEELTAAHLESIRAAMNKPLFDEQDTKMELETNGKYAETEAALLRDSVALSRGTIELMENLKERSRYIPMRLSTAERRLLMVSSGALDISEYTDHVDVSSNYYIARAAANRFDVVEKHQRYLAQAIAGVSICSDFRSLGKSTLQDRDISENESLFQDALEVARRYKIMNPDKMRSSYGKLLYAVMDNQNVHMSEQIGFSLHKKLYTVRSCLEEYNALDVLDDPLLAIAAAEIEVDTIDRMQQAYKEKRSALDILIRKYCHGEDDSIPIRLKVEDLKLVISSISDNASFLRSNRKPVDKMISYLKLYFSPNVVPADASLSIRRGLNGSMLTHSHEVQFFFVLQSLTLWREIMANFFKLWCLAEEDILDSSNRYRMANTGQGIQRCQQAPRVSKAMSDILATVKAKVGRWIGLSVVHLGDRDVPNALVFIDKYTQVPRLLAPIVQTLGGIDDIVKDPVIMEYVSENFGGTESLRKSILVDFFRHAFDGSGDDGGSCIDGRLTSTWNWCNKLDKKNFRSIFMLTGFQGFDGDFRDDI